MSESTEQGTVTSVLDLPDDQIANLDPTTFATEETQEDEGTEVTEVTTVESDSETQEVAEVTDVPETTEAEEVKEETKEPDTTEYKQFFDLVTAPFKANGANVQIKDASEVIRLMQMGANYSKKMAEFKQPRAYLKLLEDNNLLDTDKLSFLIDVHNKNPDAIAKLIRDSGLDTYEIDSEERANQYKTQVQAPNVGLIDLQDTLSEIEGTPTYARLMEVVVDTFDQDSRNRISTEPSVLKLLNEHIGNGIYDQINTIIQQERIQGRLLVPDIDAYNMVGNYLSSNNLLVTQKQVETPIVPPKPKPNAELNNRRQAASSPKPSSSSTNLGDVKNPLSMSDEEFAKFVASRV
jgi:hypothetical protein